MKAKKFQIIITAYNANNVVLFSKPQGLFSSNKRILYKTQEEAEKEVETLKALVNIPSMNGSRVEFEIKPENA
jgi:hypothetical protein